MKTTDHALAKRRLAELRIKAKGLAGEERGILFEDLVVRWMALKKSDLRPQSYKRLVSISRTLSRFFNGLLVRSVALKHIEKWKIQRTVEISARSFNYERDTLRQIFEYARLNLRIILDNPVDSVKKRKTEKPFVVIPTKEQFRILVAALENEPRAKEAPDFIEFLAYSGLRLGEGSQVCWSDVSFEMNSLVVTGGEQGTKNHETRSIPIFPPLRRLLEKLKLKHTGSDRDRIFSLDSAKQALQTACQKSGMTHFTHHSMRHFFCSNAIEAGCDFKVIAEWLGHKDGGVLVAKTYGHLRNEHSTAMAKRITFDAIQDVQSSERIVAFSTNS